MSEMVSLTQKLINAALHAVAPDTAISRHLRYIDGVLWVGERSYDVIGKKLRLIAIGKASVPMAMAVLDLLGDHIQCGVIVTKYAHVTASAQAKIAQYHPKIRLIESAHPVRRELRRNRTRASTQGSRPPRARASRSHRPRARVRGAWSS